MLEMSGVTELALWCILGMIGAMGLVFAAWILLSAGPRHLRTWRIGRKVAR